MFPLDSVGYATTWSQSTVDPDGTDIRAPHHIAGGHESALAAIDTAMFRPCAAYRAGLRRVGLIHLNAGSELVVKQRDDLAVTGRRHRLRLLPAHLLCGIIERLANVGFGVGEYLSNLACRFVAESRTLLLAWLSIRYFWR